MGEFENRIRILVGNGDDVLSKVLRTNLRHLIEEARREFPEADKEWAGYLEHPYRKWFEKWFGVTR